MGLPLEGIRVLDLSRAQMGPYAGVMRAEMGAEVIKVEPGQRGEMSRWAFSFYPRETVAANGKVNAYILAQNRGKKGITTDYTREEGKEVIFKLARISDVFLENFRPGVIEALGLDYEKISQVNPQIVYCSASGFGQKGPLANHPAFDLIGQAMGGIMCQTGDPEGDPTPVGAAIGDQVGAMLLAYGIVLALFVRQRTGIGQKVDVSMLDAQLALQSWEATHYLVTGQLPPKGGRGLGLIPGLWLIFKTKDNRWIAVVAVQEERWPGFCRAMGIEHLQNDPRFDTPSKREASRDKLVAILDKLFLSKTAEEWLRLLREEDQAVGPVYTYADILAHPQVMENEMIVSLHHPSAGEIRMIGIPVKLSKTPGRVKALAPELGQHTEEVLLGLGYTQEHIARLRSQQII